MYAKKRILIVDDEEMNIESLKTLLDTINIGKNLLDFCINGKEALDKVVDAYNNNIEYSVIFMDYSMPVMNGIDSTIAIRSFFTNKAFIPSN